MKMKLFNLIFALIPMTVFSNSLFAGQIGEIERDSAGNVLKMNHSQAAAYCSNLKLRLPSAREYAVLAQSNGVRIRESNYPKIPFDFPQVVAETKANDAEKFYLVAVL